MAEARNQQQPLMDDTTFRTNFELPHRDDDPSDDVRNSRGELTTEHTDTDMSTLDPRQLLKFLVLLYFQNSGDNNSVSRVAEELQPAIDEFIEGWRQRLKNITGRELSANEENAIRQLLPAWNIFLQLKQDAEGTSAIISSDITGDIKKFIEFNLIMGEQCTVDDKKWIISCLQRWNMFLQARAGEKLVTGCGMFFTVIGLFFFLLDQVSDIGTAIYYGYMGQWWQAILTLVLVYASIIIHTATKFLRGQIHCTGTADWLRYISALLVNWPDVKQYGVLCRLEWKLYKSPETNAHLVPEWDTRRLNVAFLKLMEGEWEACPQAILQLYLLLPDLYGDLTWTDYLRIGPVCISLCTAGAALTNLIKQYKIGNYIDLPMCELVVLHMWAVPVTVSRLLSVALLLTVEPYWGLAGVALHVILYGVNWCRTNRAPSTLDDVLAICQDTLLFFISPLYVAGSITYSSVLHAIHLLGNTVATVVWALGTPLACSHPALYTAIICFNAVMFVLGLVGWVLHEKYWPDSYLKRNYLTPDILLFQFGGIDSN